MKNILISLLFISSLTLSLSCDCTRSDPPKAFKDPPADFTWTEVTADEENLGVPVPLGKIIVLNIEYKIAKSIKGPLYTCPTGFTPLYRADLDQLSKTTNIIELIKKLTNVNLPIEAYIVSNTKTYPSSTDGTKNQSWAFDALIVTSIGLINEEYDTFFGKGGIGLCALDGANADIKVNSFDFYRGYKYNAKVLTGNLSAFYWQFGENSADKDQADVYFTSNGCNTLKFWGQLGNGDVVYACRKIWVNNIEGNDTNVTFTENTIQTKVLTQSAVINRRMFFNAGTAQVVPLDQGAFIVVYGDLNNNLKGIHYDKEFNLVKEHDLINNALLFSATSTINNGLMIYAEDAKDSDRSYIQEFDKDFNSLFSRNIINNGPMPTSIKDQVTFYRADKKPEFGLDAMFNPNNGRIAFGRSKLGLLFAHYNNFNAGKSSDRDDHTGDTFFQFDASTGKNEKMAWAWKTSHSNVQQMLYDGKYFVTASLGDIYPENIVVCLIQPSDETSDRIPPICEDLVSYKIPGNGKGDTCGKLGGVHKKGSLYAVVFSIQPCQLNSSTTKNFIALITFELVNNKISNKKEMSFNAGDGQKIVSLQSVKFGANLLVLTAERDTGNDYNQKHTIQPTDKSFATVVDFNGQVVKAKIELAAKVVSASDPIAILDGGNLAWATVDENGKLNLHHTAESFPSQSLPYSDSGTVLTSDDKGTTTAAHYLAGIGMGLAAFLII